MRFVRNLSRDGVLNLAATLTGVTKPTAGNFLITGYGVDYFLEIRYLIVIF